MNISSHLLLVFFKGTFLRAGHRSNFRTLTVNTKYTFLAFFVTQCTRFLAFSIEVLVSPNWHILDMRLKSFYSYIKCCININERLLKIYELSESKSTHLDIFFSFVADTANVATQDRPIRWRIDFLSKLNKTYTNKLVIMAFTNKCWQILKLLSKVYKSSNNQYRFL